MRTLLVLAALGWLMSLPWQVVLFCVVIMIAGVSYIMLRLHTLPDRHGGRKAGIDHHYVAALESMVVEAEEESDRLRTEINRLRASCPVSEPDPKVALFRRVGLSPAAPEWLVLAARRAYRTQLHPDRHPPWAKEEAERRFKRAEATFDAITACRN